MNSGYIFVRVHLLLNMTDRKLDRKTGRMMANHFTNERWSDYVRGVLPAPEAAAIEQHLEKGCETCQQSYRLWRNVAETAKNEARSQVPERLVHIVQTAYTARQRLYLMPRRARMARLLFDSLLEPLPAGVRGRSSSPRRIVGRSGRWSIDLRLEPSAGKTMFLTGQILGEDPHHSLRAGLPILLMGTDTLLAETTANQFGEFQFQFDRANGLSIYADIPGQRPIALLLPDFDSPPAGEALTD
jgi:hypothetical protein